MSNNPKEADTTNNTHKADAHTSDAEKSSAKSQAEELSASKEYILVLKNALKEVIEENELVSILAAKS